MYKNIMGLEKVTENKGLKYERTKYKKLKIKNAFTAGKKLSIIENKIKTIILLLDF